MEQSARGNRGAIGLIRRQCWLGRADRTATPTAPCLEASSTALAFFSQSGKLRLLRETGCRPAFPFARQSGWMKGFYSKF